jgi:hypothetical protein
MGQINTNNYPTVDSLTDADLLIVENATNGTGTTTPKQLRENAIGTGTLQTSAQTVTGAINELKHEIDLGAGVARYDVNTITSGYLGQFSGSANLLLLHLTTDGIADATNGYMMMLSYSRPVARFAYGRLVDSDGVAYKQDVYADNTIICTISGSGEGTESDPVQVVILGIINAGFMLTPTAVVSDRDIIDGQGNTLSVLAEALTKTASGNPVVISDCAGGKARSLITEINAIQDLHGYDKPWVGGAGKNLYGGTVGTIFDLPKTIPANTQIAISFTRTASDQGNAVTLNLYKSGESTRYDYYTISDSSRVVIVTDDTARVLVYGTDIDITNIQIEIGSTATSFAPYSNICPISGRTAVAVDDVGKNVLPNTYTGYTRNGITWTVDSEGIIDADGTATAHEGMTIISQADLQRLLAEYGDLIITGCPTGGGDSTYQIVTSFNGSYAYDRGNGLTLPANGTYSLGIMVQIRNGYTARHVKFKVMLRPANTSATYEPYAHSSVTIQLGQTVYGAEINWNTGVMTVRTAAETFDGSDDESWNWSTANSLAWIEVNGAFITDDVTQHNVYTLNNMFEDKSWVDKSNSGSVGLVYGNSRVYVKYSGITSVADAKALFASNPLQVCYELAEPIELTLTPTEVQMLKGYNRVTIDNGSIELGYIAKLT